MSDNWSDIGGGRYLVRTQAGFKQALNAWLSSQDMDRQSAKFNEGTTFPEVFPSVVSFNWWYRGVYYVTVQHEHVNAFRQRMADMMRRLDDADPIDRDGDLVSRVARAAWEELNRQHEVAGLWYGSRAGQTVLDGWYDLDAMARVVIKTIEDER